MINRKPLEASLAAVKKAFPKAKPKLGMILGSGLSEIAEAFEQLGVLPYAKIPGVGAAGVAPAGAVRKLLSGCQAECEGVALLPLGPAARRVLQQLELHGRPDSREAQPAWFDAR